VVSLNEPEPYYRLGLIASAKGDSRSALLFWSKALQLRPGYPEANFMAGEELLRKQMPEKAHQFYELALSQDPSKLLYYIRLGVAEFRLQHYPAAIEVFTRGLSRFPDNANLAFLIGYANRAQGHYDDALVAFNKARAVQPENADVLANLGYIAGQRGQDEEATQLLRQAIKLDANNFAAHHDLGRLLIKLKKYDESVAILEHGVTINDKDAGIHYQLFLAYSRLGRKADADREFATFKKYEAEATAHAPTALGQQPAGMSTKDREVTPPLPAAVSGETGKHPAP